MSLFLANYAQNQGGVNAAVLSGGNGSNSTTQLAIATIDPRYGNTFTIDTSKLTIWPDEPLQEKVFVRLKSAKPNIGALRPGKIINIIVKFSEAENRPKTISLSFDTSLGTNILPLSTAGGGSFFASFSMIADGTQFRTLGMTNDWGFND